MSQVFKNGARTELDNEISAVTTQFTVIDGTVFPVANASVTGGVINQTSGDWFKLVLQDDDNNFEIVYCYGHEYMTHTFTVLRGQEGTTALDFPVGTVVGLRFLSSDLDAIHNILSTKVGKVTGKGLSQEDFTTAEKNKLEGIPAGATKNRPDSETPALSTANAFTDTTPSTSTTTGAMKVYGGLGVQGAIHTGSTPSWLSPSSQTAPMVFIKDVYRQQVEAASGGRQTVLYTAKGQPSIMNIIPVFNLQDINAGLGTGVHPAFIVGGVQKSELFIGTHIGSVSENELISQPKVEPANSRNHDQFVTLARACGAGWHVMTNAEWSAIALWSHKNGTMPRGNTNYGRSSDALYETARRMDLLEHGNTSGNPLTRTGSGPATWRHDHTMHGISDLCGNGWEWNPGMRAVYGEIQVIANNDAALTATDFSENSSAWCAIDGATGDLVAPGHANAVKYAASGTEAYTLVCTNSAPFERMTNPGSTPVSVVALQKLKAYGLFPVAGTGLGGDTFWYSSTKESIPLRGGNYAYGGLAGMFAINLSYMRTTSNMSTCARPAFVL